MESDKQYHTSTDVTAFPSLPSSPSAPVNARENEKFFVNCFPSAVISTGILPCTTFNVLSAVNRINVVVELLFTTDAVKPVIPVLTEEFPETAVLLILVTFVAIFVAFLYAMIFVSATPPVAYSCPAAKV